jgi:hypothetical protein
MLKEGHIHLLITQSILLFPFPLSSRVIDIIIGGSKNYLVVIFHAKQIIVQ